MVFNSLQYAVFLPVVVLGYFLLPQRARWVLLLVASYYFYMSWNPNLVVLILFTTATSFFSALGIARAGQNRQLRRFILILGVGSSLLCLFFFKYFNFFSANITALLRAFSLPVEGFALQVLLPVGISFYTFQTLSYVIDVYRGNLAVERNFGIYALFVSFFPQLVAGPIERAGSLLPQFRERHTFSTTNLSGGLRRILWGLFKKVVVADYISVFADRVYNDVHAYAGVSLVLATVLFAVQIYCDFSGYSDIAVGSARIMGFRLMENFKSPYVSRSIREFWRRWHISLSTWFSDYVYKPLGGNRVSPPRHLFNLFFTFLLSGMWHGAAWNFLLWGALHGLWLCCEVFWLPRRDRRFARAGRGGKAALSVWWWAVTMVVVMAGWVLFRANSMADAAYVFTHFFRGLAPANWAGALSSMGFTPVVAVQVALLFAILFGWDWLNRNGEAPARLHALKAPLRYAAYYGIGFLLLLRIFTTPGGVAAPFIYFQF